MTDLFRDYGLGPAWDEMFAAPGQTREPYDAVAVVLRPLGGEELAVRLDALARAFLDQGVTFALDGEDRPFPLDLVPRVIAADEWAVVSRGVSQRVRALEAFLADVYGERRVVADGVVPHRLIVTSAHYSRAAHLTLLLLREAGLSARYASGYLHPKGADASVGETTTGESHAWVEWWNGEWVGFDPTNGVPLGPQHVAVALGRDYDDVPPLKGIYSGPPTTGQEVTVEVTRLS